MTGNKQKMNPSVVVAVLMLVCVVTASAQDPEGRRRRGDGARDFARRLKAMDSSGGGKVSKDEFPGREHIFNRLDSDGDGWFTREEARATRRRFTGDDGAPRVGEAATAFTLKSRDGKRAFDLTAHKGKRPVVLFFGSYT